MAEYQVPEVVYQYYPELIDDYIRAATGAARQDEYDPWYDIAGQVGKSISGVATGFINDYFKERSDARAYENRLNLETRKQEQMEARQRAVVEAKEAAKAQADEMKRASQMGALQDFYLRRAPRMLETPGVQGYDAEGLVDQRPPREELEYPSEMPMETWAQMMRENPEQAMLAAQGFAELGKGGAFGDALKGALMTPSAQNTQSQIDSRGRRDALAEEKEARLGYQFEATQQRLIAQLEANIENQKSILALRERGVAVDEAMLKLKQERDELEKQLLEARTNQANAAAAKARASAGGTGGPKVLTANQQVEMDNAKKWVEANHPNITDPDTKESLAKWYYSTKPWKGGSKSSQTIGGKELMSTERTPMPTPYPGLSPSGSTGDEAYFNQIMGAIDKATSWDPNSPRLQQAMSRLSPEQQALVREKAQKKFGKKR